jgi:hypothetical protein
LSKLADVATGSALISGGVGVAPSYGKIGLTTHVSGVLPVANGGTNASVASITAFNNITGYTAAGATGTTSSNLVFSTTPTLAGDVTLSTGNLVVGTSGKGIDFSATPGTGTSELLADYEEGTWTPTITGSSSSGATYVSQSGKYTKIGRQVTVVFDVEASAVTATGSMRIGGLPFTIIAGDPQATGSCMINNLNWSGGTMMTLFAAGGADYLQLYGSADDASFTQQQCVNESQRILGTLTHFV